MATESKPAATAVTLATGILVGILAALPAAQEQPSARRLPAAQGQSSARQIPPAAQEQQPPPQEPEPPAEQEPPPEPIPPFPTRVWWFGGRGVLMLPSDDSLETAFGFTGFAVYTLTSDIEFEIEAGLLRPSSRADGLPEGRLTLIPVLGTVRFRVWRFGGAVPYAGGGGGLYITDFNVDSDVRRQFAELGFAVSEKIESTVGVHGVAGAEWRRDRWLFGADVKYVLADATALSRVTDQVTGAVFGDSSIVDLNGFWLSFTVRYQY